MKKIIRVGRVLALSAAVLMALTFGATRLVKAATAIEIPNGLFHAVNVLLNNLDIRGIIGLDTNNQLSIQATSSGANVNVYSSTGTFAGTLEDKDGTVVYSGCRVIGDVNPPQ